MRSAVDDSVFAAADALAVLSPCHAAGIPLPLARYLADLPEERLRGKNAAVVLTIGGMAGFGLMHLTAPLVRKGMRVVSKRALLMPDNFPPIMPAAASLNWGTEDRDAAEAHLVSLPALLRDPAAPRAARRGRNLALPMSFRWALRRGVGPIRIDPDACRKCGMCVRACPTGCISQAPGAVPVQAFEDCVACLGCWHACPFDALHTTCALPVDVDRFRFNATRLDTGAAKTTPPKTSGREKKTR